jgi:hypothetical protein
VEDGDLADIVCSGAERKGRGSRECWVLLVKEKKSDKIIEVHLTDMRSE